MVDRLQVRRLVDEAVRDYDERALTGSSFLLNPAQAPRVVYDAVAGCARLRRHLDDSTRRPRIEELWNK